MSDVPSKYHYLISFEKWLHEKLRFHQKLFWKDCSWLSSVFAMQHYCKFYCHENFHIEHLYRSFSRMPNLNTIIKNVCLTLFILYFNKNLRNFGNAVWAIFPTRSGNEMNIEKKSLNSSISSLLFSIREQNLKPRGSH